MSSKKENNLTVQMRRAEFGFADIIAPGESYLDHFDYARELGYKVIRSSKPMEGRVIFDGNRSFFLRMSEPYVAGTRYPRHNNKHETKILLESIGIDSPKGKLFSPNSVEKLVDYYASMESKSVVLKPSGLNKGKGVFVGVNSEENLRHCYAQVRKYSCMLEEIAAGHEHRLLVIGGRVVAAAKRTPASVVGNGSDSISQLIEMKNEIRMKSRVHRRNLVTIDDELISIVNEQGLDLNSIPDDGSEINLRKVSNVSMGGESEDVTDIVHSSFLDVAEKIWDAFPDRAIYGVDIITPDISKPTQEIGYKVIEVNNRPMLEGLHGRPIKGSGRQVGKKVIDYIFG